MGFTIEPLEAVADGYVAHGQFYHKPTRITQMCCERHQKAAITDDVLKGIRYFGLRILLEPYTDIGYEVGAEINRDGTPRIFVSLYDLQRQASER